MQELLGVGRLTSLEIFDPATERTRTMRVAKKWLGWMPGKKQFVICGAISRGRRFVGTGQPYPKSAAIKRAHKRFHEAPARSMITVDVPSPVGRCSQIGLLKALTYRVPRQVTSPGKNPFHWHHAFGDTGHKGGVYTAKVMPAVVRDSKGNLFIRRRKGNIFTVDTWLRG